MYKRLAPVAATGVRRPSITPLFFEISRSFLRKKIGLCFLYRFLPNHFPPTGPSFDAKPKKPTSNTWDVSLSRRFDFIKKLEDSLNGRNGSHVRRSSSFKLIRRRCEAFTLNTLQQAKKATVARRCRFLTLQQAKKATVVRRCRFLTPRSRQWNGGSC